MEPATSAGIRRPPWWRQALPYLLAAAILYWIFKDIDFARFVSRLASARMRLLIPAMLGFTALYAACDVMSYGMCYRWFAAPDISIKEMAAARLGAYLLHVLFTPLSTLANLAYLRLRKGAPLVWSLSANAFTSVHDLFAINAVLTGALAINLLSAAAPRLRLEWFWPVTIPWAAAAGYALYWFTPVRDAAFLKRVTENPILRSCRFAKARHYLWVLSARTAVAVAGVAAHAAAMHAFGIEVPLQVIMVVAPLMVGISFMPVSAAGYGGPQLVALLLLPYADGDKALVEAYSVAFSTLFTVGRAGIGIVFMPLYTAGVRTRALPMAADPLTGENLGEVPGERRE